MLRHLDIWQTVYTHPLAGVGAIIAWLETTGLRPYLAPLDAVERAAFLHLYRSLLAAHYPEQADGKVLLRFPRLFVLGVR